MIANESSSSDKDQLYKILLQTFFKEFVELFLPFLVHRIDFSKTEFLLQEMFTDLPRGNRKRLDLVVKVRLQEEQESIIIIHVEVEAKKKAGISRRMFKYFAQLYLRYERDIIPIVVFADDHLWKQEIDREYKVEYDESYLNFRYKKIKLKELDYKKYLTSNNPLAHALMVKMGFDKKERVKVKAEALRLILTNRIDEARQSILINFVNESMVLTEEDEELFSKIIYQEERYMEVKEMITIYEEKGIEKGIEKGELIGDIRIAQLMKGLSMSDKKELEKLSIDDLKNKLQELAKG
jgi:hypothetical protein